jgi:acetyl-CoA carboxylase carboxyltransferase component
VVREVTGEDVTLDELGGPAVHERTGVCHAVAPTEADAAILTRELLSYLPDRAGASPSSRDPEEPLLDDPGAPVPSNGRQVYDMRMVVRALVDRGALLEIQSRWARNMLIGFARVEGRSVGIVANQPRYLGGILDAEAAQKAARFIRTCNLFGIPLLVLVDTPGFLPGTGQERGAVIRHGAKLVHAFAEATVPSVTVVLRKAFGGAYITMNSRELGADMVLAWPGAELGVMGAPQAVGVVNRRDLAASADPERLRARLADSYAEEHLTTAGAAAGGHIDEVIHPSESRDRIADAFEVFAHVDHDAANGIIGRNLPL